MKVKIQKYKSPLKEKEKEPHDVKKTLKETERERELETLKSTTYTCTSSQPGKEFFKWL